MIKITIEATRKLCTLPFDISKYVIIYLEAYDKKHTIVGLVTIDDAIKYAEEQNKRDLAMDPGLPIEAMADQDFIPIETFIEDQKRETK